MILIVGVLLFFSIIANGAQLKQNQEDLLSLFSEARIAPIDACFQQCLDTLSDKKNLVFDDFWLTLRGREVKQKYKIESPYFLNKEEEEYVTIDDPDIQPLFTFIATNAIEKYCSLPNMKIIESALKRLSVKVLYEFSAVSGDAIKNIKDSKKFHGVPTVNDDKNFYDDLREALIHYHQGGRRPRFDDPRVSLLFSKACVEHDDFLKSDSFERMRDSIFFVAYLLYDHGGKEVIQTILKKACFSEGKKLALKRNLVEKDSTTKPHITNRVKDKDLLEQRICYYRDGRRPRFDDPGVSLLFSKACVKHDDFLESRSFEVMRDSIFFVAYLLYDQGRKEVIQTILKKACFSEGKKLALKRNLVEKDSTTKHHITNRVKDKNLLEQGICYYRDAKSPLIQMREWSASSEFVPFLKNHYKQICCSEL